jgi:hypothetical protein
VGWYFFIRQCFNTTRSARGASPMALRQKSSMRHLRISTRFAS